ncbi:hypothetical protein [Priestia taiwanensis]|uniref:Uncharacterized protein n=1 Tax=Priestia taiwanensis TaxID=1347902 RepID=A0A917AXV9_9BACI|nr:hypothetical protein [Priestia taiwanensis]MBM7365260.1 hypothetical protein [Priestia taiwanensis]GGE85741.1 hypothetical protein GCM10007140_38880 [Priestia taiwanensis]
MTLYTFIASDNPLVEVDNSGFIHIKVRDLKKVEPKLDLEFWGNVDDESMILYAKEESELGGLEISLCDNPPNGLEQYINKKYIYWLEGDFGSEFLKQLTEYVKLKVKIEDKVELWSILFGEGIKTKQVKSLSLNEISEDSFKILHNHKCCCLVIE